MANPIVWFLAIISLFYFLYGHHQRSKYLKSLPWIGTQDKLIFPRLRARFSNVFGFQKSLESGYRKYTSQGKTFVLPTIDDNLIILPTNEINWIISQPDNILSTNQPHIDHLQTDYTFSHPIIIRIPTHHYVLKTDLTRQLGFLTEDIVDELARSSDDHWSTDEQNFTDVHVFGTLLQIVARTSNRIFVGLPWCRDPEFLDNAAGFAHEVPTMSILLRQLPEYLRPVIAPILMRKNKKHIAVVTEQIRPEIVRRQAIFHAAPPNGKETANLPNDLLTWLIENAETGFSDCEGTPEIIAGRLLAVQFAAIHTSTFSITNCIFDLLAAPDGPSYIAQLREEAISVLAANDNVWNKNALSQMHKIDSTLRESSRLSSFLGPGLVRKVIAKGGITSPNGTFCPYGSNIATLTYGIHNDESNYPNASTFNPFRFANQRLESQPDLDTNTDFIRKANLSFVSTSPTYHPFGHGRHVCPGRFFAANELKLLLAYLVINYDFEYLKKRPENRWLGTTLVPPMKASIRVKRRKSDGEVLTGHW